MRLLLLLLLPTLAAAQTPADAARAQAEGRLVRGLTEHALGNDSAAVRLYEEAAAIAPGSAGPLDALAEAYTALGRPAEALYHAGLAVRAAPENAGARLRLGMLQAAAGGRADALASLEQARRLSPADAATLTALARVYRDAGRAGDERSALEALAATTPTVAALLRLAETAPDAASLQAALAAANRLAPGDPNVRARLVQTATPTADASARGSASAGTASGGSADAALAIVSGDPRRLDAWAEALTALAATRDPRAGATADDATLLFPTVPSILAPAAEAYLAAGRSADAIRTARSGLAALDAAPDAILRARLDRVLSLLR